MVEIEEMNAPLEKVKELDPNLMGSFGKDFPEFQMAPNMVPQLSQAAQLTTPASMDAEEDGLMKDSL